MDMASRETGHHQPQGDTTMQVQEHADRLGHDESVAEFCERSAIVTARRECAGQRGWVECRIVTPVLYCTIPDGYQCDDCGSEQDEPSTGAKYRFTAGGNNPLAPFGGWDMLAHATREGDLLILEIEQAD
jgi:hypothetical protein